MTPREVFETVKHHLLTQAVRSEDPEEGLCLYRGPDGAKCAAGCLIADEHYRRCMERQLSSFPDVRDALVASGVPRECCDDSETKYSLVRRLQLIHDQDPPSCWARRLDALEDEYFGGAE